MIISNSNYWPEVDIQASLYQGSTSEPFIVRFANGTTIHMSPEEVQTLHTQLTAAMYEYDTNYKYKETQNA